MTVKKLRPSAAKAAVVTTMARNILFHSQIKKSTTATSNGVFSVALLPPLSRHGPLPHSRVMTHLPAFLPCSLGTGQWSKDIESKNWPEQLERSIP